MSRLSKEPQEVEIEPDREDDQRGQSPERECESVAVYCYNRLIPIPSGLDEAREEVALALSPRGRESWTSRGTGAGSRQSPARRMWAAGDCLLPLPRPSRSQRCASMAIQHYKTVPAPSPRI